MTRSSMSNLMARVRGLIFDPAGDSQQFTDQDIQDALDPTRQETRYGRLEPLESRAPGGAVTYLIFQAPWGDWEEDVELVDGSYNVLTPSAADYLAGRWTFESEPAGAVVLIVGKSYDLYAAAADLLLRWSASVKFEYTFSPGKGNYTRSQKFAMCMEMVAAYRAKARIQAICAERTDVC